MDNPTEINKLAGVSVVTPPPIAREPSSGPRRSSKRIMAGSSKKTAPADTPYVCPICFDDTQTKMLALSCSHKFCPDCWTAYTSSKIRGEGEHHITCMAEDCSLVAPDSFIKSVLSDEVPTWKRYNELLARYYVSCNRKLKYCPYPECTQTVSCPSAASKFALATIIPIVHCGVSEKHQFCFACPIEDDHKPVICSVAKLWLQKCRDDSETANWIKSNTKECSKCQSTIEKNGGCKCVFV